MGSVFVLGVREDEESGERDFLDLEKIKQIHDNGGPQESPYPITPLSSLS